MIRQAEQMTFTRGQPSHLITHFHKVAGLARRAQGAHACKQQQDDPCGLPGEAKQNGCDDHGKWRIYGVTF